MGLFGGQGIEGHLPGAGKVADLVLQGVMLLPAASCDVALFAAAAPPRWPPRPLRFRPLERQVAATRALYRYCITEGLLRGSNTGTPYRSGRGCARFKESCNPRMLLCYQRGCGLVPHRISLRPAVVTLSRPQSRSGYCASFGKKSAIQSLWVGRIPRIGGLRLHLGFAIQAFPVRSASGTFSSDSTGQAPIQE